MIVKYYIKEMRIHHYLKNFLIFLPLFCSGEILADGKLMLTIPGFLSFCIASSVVYIMNDIKDREKDRKHPTKSKRPIAAGIITVRYARLFAITLFGISIGFQFFFTS